MVEQKNIDCKHWFVLVEVEFLWHTDIFYASWGNTEICLDLWLNKSILWLMYKELMVLCFSYRWETDI